jgi:hypothetical protein
VLVLTKPEIFIVSPLSKYAIDHLGNENANTLTGTSNDEIFVAGAGDDTLTVSIFVLTKPEVFTVSPLLPNTLRILVLVEASNRSFRLG